jgi:hypothetical protein
MSAGGTLSIDDGGDGEVVRRCACPSPIPIPSRCGEGVSDAEPVGNGERDRDAQAEADPEAAPDASSRPTVPTCLDWSAWPGNEAGPNA